MSTEVPTREIHQLRPRVAVATRQPQPPTQVVAVPKNCAFTTSASECLKTIRFREQETKPSVSRVPASVLLAFLLVGPASEAYTTARSDMNPSSEMQCRTRSAISTCLFTKVRHPRTVPSRDARHAKSPTRQKHGRCSAHRPRNTWTLSSTSEAWNSGTSQRLKHHPS